MHVIRKESLFDSRHFFNALYAFQLVADGLDVVHVVDTQLDFAVENAVLRGDSQFPDVDVELSGEDARDFMQDTDMVDAADFDGGREEQRLVHVPRGRKDVVAVAGLKLGGHGALAFVDIDTSVLGLVAQHVIARNGMATVGNDEIRYGFFAQHEGLLPVNGRSRRRL